MPEMPLINRSFNQLSTSPTLRINQKINELKAQGKTVAHFGFGQSPFSPPELLQQTLAECVGEHGYLPVQGLASLRESIAHWMQNVFKISCEADQIFIGPGSKQCIFDLLFLLEGNLMIPQGSWVSYQPMATLLNKRCDILPTRFEDRYCLTADTLEQYAQGIPGQKILILNSPNNPTGQIYTEKSLSEIAKVCEQHDIIVISDEIYGLIQFEESSYTSIQHFLPERTIITNGISKAFSAGGYRLGFAVLPKAFKSMHSAYNTLISETYSAVASPVQFAAKSLFEQYEKIKPYIKCCNHIHRWVLDYTYQRLSAVGYQTHAAQGGFYLLAHLQPFKESLAKQNIKTSQALCDVLLERYGVALLPSSDFGFEEEHLGFRLSPVDYEGEKILKVYSSQEADLKVGEWFPHIEQGLDQLVNFVHSLNGK